VTLRLRTNVDGWQKQTHNKVPSRRLLSHC